MGRFTRPVLSGVLLKRSNGEWRRQTPFWKILTDIFSLTRPANHLHPVGLTKLNILTDFCGNISVTKLKIFDNPNDIEILY